MADFQVTPVPKNYKSFEPQSPGAGFSAAKTLKLLIGLSIILVIIAAALFLFIREPFNVGGVDFNLEGPTEVSAGEEVVYILKYKNNTDKKLERVKISFFYPPNSIILREGEISDVPSERIEINDLLPGESGEKELRLFLIGDKGNVKTARAIFSFGSENIKSDFQKESELATTITSIPVSLTLVAPPNAMPGQEITYLLDYRNESENDISNVRFLFSYPDNFSITSFSPQPSGDTTKWDISLLKKGEGSRIEIKGIIFGSERESKSISIVLQRKINDSFIDFERASSTTVISSPLLSLNVKVNNSIDYISRLRDTLRYSISFQNNSKQDLVGVTISASIEGTMFDASTIQSDGFFDSRLKSIIWNASSFPKLGLLRAGEGGEVTFRIKIRDSFPTSGVGSKDFFVKVKVRADVLNVPEEFGSLDFAAQDELLTRLSTSPTLTQSVYASSIFGSFGPVPPRVNQKTIYTVYWKIVNPASDIIGSRVSAVLPPGVEWENKTQISGTQTDITFNSGTRIVVWDIQVIPSRIGIIFPPAEGYFQVSVIPSENQIEKVITLLKDAKFEGIDSFTREAISITLRNETTQTVVDGGDGRVRE